MEFDLPKTAAVFVFLIVLGVVGTMPMMGTGTVLMMVLPSMVIFGLLMLATGVKHGEYRTTHR
jgi:hypothetical protein